MFLLNKSENHLHCLKKACRWNIQNPWKNSKPSKKLYTSNIQRICKTAKMSKFEEKYNDQFHESGFYGMDDVVNLIMGAPGTTTLIKSVEIMKEATNHRLAQETENGYLMQYGPGLGDWRYRENLAKFLSERYQEPVLFKNIMLTSGASQGLYFAASLLFGVNSTVFVEDPTYFIALNVFKKDLNMIVKPIPLDSEGIDITSLEQQLRQLKIPKGSTARSFRAMVYLIPAFQNPSGVSYSEERCRQLVALAQQYNLLLFCDDVYNLLNYSSEKPPRPLIFFEDVDDSGTGHIISNGTFSKIFSPGVRLGWIQASLSILKLLSNSSFVFSGGNFNNYTGGLISSALALGLQSKHLDMVKEMYAKRMTMVSKILKEKLPEGCSFKEPGGGYFFWIVLPLDIKADECAEWTKINHKITFQPGNRCSALGNFRNCIRIAITFHEEDVLLKAVEKLCQALHEYIEKERK